ncbi:MAG: endonuclease/exonuclease/phosphatase family protein [Patescibacteria group bacterium]|nr:endonuclease/exonuclease/phosphatase family protein [Patescibacteria group bacterium]
MKLVSLNTFGATQGEIFFNYIKQHRDNTDIFCLQEVFSASGNAPKIYGGFHLFELQELRGLLPGFKDFYEAKSFGYADATDQKIDVPVSFGMSIFVRENFKTEDYGACVLGDGVAAGGPLLEGLVKSQTAVLEAGGQKLRIINIHGLSRPGDKLDTPARLEQSRKILEILTGQAAPTILCGDFNLMPETESIRMLEGKMRNLVKEFNIANTRNEISWQQYHNRQYFADYVFVSPGIKVQNFRVPYNLASDHLPMILEFELKI